jgi:four helix bundle protein
MPKNFRFEDLQIWQDAIAIGDELYDIADHLTELKKYRFASQLDGAAIGISNNIAEGSGSVSQKDFANYLMIARKSLFECVNLLHVFQRRGLIEPETRLKLYPQLQDLSRGIYKFRQSLLR